MVNLFDTHAHLDSEQLFNEAENIVTLIQEISSALKGKHEESAPHGFIRCCKA